MPSYGRKNIGSGFFFLSYGSGNVFKVHFWPSLGK